MNNAIPFGARILYFVAYIHLTLPDHLPTCKETSQTDEISRISTFSKKKKTLRPQLQFSKDNKFTVTTKLKLSIYILVTNHIIMPSKISEMKQGQKHMEKIIKKCSLKELQ